MNNIKSYIKENILFLAVMLFIILIRFYYFWITKSQPLWWDEAEYMATAKGFAGMIDFPYVFSLNRLPGFPLLASAFYAIGINNEIVLKFILAFIPSIIVFFLMYALIAKMYGKQNALISVLILSLLWEHVFYSNRFHTENISLIFGLLAMLALFKESKYKYVKIIIFSILCVFFRSGNMIVIPVIVLFLVITIKSKQIRNFSLIVLGICGGVALFVLKDLAIQSPQIHLFYHYELPIAWGVLNVFNGFYQSVIPNILPIFFYAFLIGIVFAIYQLFIGENKKFAFTIPCTPYQLPHYNKGLIC